MEIIKDSCGLDIVEDLYGNESDFHYYQIRETPEGLMIKGANDREYSPLDSFTASKLRRIPNSKELVSLVFSVGQHPFKKDGDPPHPFKKYAQSQPKCTPILTAEGVLGVEE